MFWIICLIIWLCLMYGWHFYCADYQDLIAQISRNRLYELSGFLFDAAMDGKISFQHKAYGMTRKTINGMIRNIRIFNITSIVCLLCVNRLIGGAIEKRNEGFQQQLSKAIDSLSPNQRDLILSIRFQATLIVLNHIFKTSFVMIPFLILHRIIRLYHGSSASEAREIPIGMDKASKLLRKIDPYVMA